MALSRDLIEISVRFSGDTPVVTATVLVRDDAEGTASGIHKVVTHASVMTPAAALRDAVLALAAATGKTLTLPPAPVGNTVL